MSRVNFPYSSTLESKPLGIKIGLHNRVTSLQLKWLKMSEVFLPKYYAKTKVCRSLDLLLDPFVLCILATDFIGPADTSPKCSRSRKLSSSWNEVSLHNSSTPSCSTNACTDVQPVSRRKWRDLSLFSRANSCERRGKVGQSKKAFRFQLLAKV